jgi:hypothetical protein
MIPPDFATPVRGPSYSLPLRVGVTVVALVVVLGALRWSGVFAIAGWTSHPALVVVATVFGTVGSWYFFMRSVTIIDATGIQQTGLVSRKITWSEVAKARVTRWGVTRLIVRGARGPFPMAFYGGTPELRSAFERIAQASGKP